MYAVASRPTESEVSGDSRPKAQTVDPARGYARASRKDGFADVLQGYNQLPASVCFVGSYAEMLVLENIRVDNAALRFQMNGVCTRAFLLTPALLASDFLLERASLSALGSFVTRISKVTA